MKELKRYLKVYRTCLRNALIREMEFRLNFFIWGLAMLVEYLIVFYFFYTIYQDVSSISGWNKYEWYFYLGFVQILLTFFMTFIFPNLVALPWQINGGELDFHLLKPINVQFMVSLRRVNLGYVVNFVAGFALAGYGLSHISISMSWLQILGTVIYGLVGIIILYSIFMVCVTISIWTKRANFASDFFFQLWNFMRNPASIYSQILRIFFSYIVPVLLIATVPAGIFLGKMTVKNLLVTVVVGLVWFFGSKFFWERAIRSYTSASS